MQHNYPEALNRTVLSAWLQDETDLAPQEIVAVSPSAATAIVGRSTTPDGRPQVRLRAVAITPQAVARGGVLAWEMPLELDCKGRQVRAGATTGYATRRGASEGLALAPADGAWRAPKSGTILEAAWRAVCDARFVSPLSGAPLKIAESAPPAPPAARSAESPAPPVALATSEPPPPAPARLTPARLRVPDADAARAPASPRPVSPKPAAHKAGHATVQVVSSPVEADSRRKLERLQHRFGDALQEGVETRIVQAKVEGKTVYRGVVTGFATHGEARAFCRTLKQSGQDCISY